MSDTQPPLVWIDLEMSGLDPVRERILEIACLVTNSDLEVLAEGPELVIHQADSLLEAMDAWNKEHHGGSGLIERVKRSTVTEEEAEQATLEFLRQHCQPGASPLAGNSVHHDKRFLARSMPGLVEFLHYRIVDVSTIKELAGRWHPEVLTSAPPKQEQHRALADIRESVEELRHYRKTLFPPVAP